MRIMQSYIAAPQIHANAVKNPKMLGGPFIDYGGERVDEIRDLLDETAKKRRNLVELSKAIEDLEHLLREHARGFSLAPLYVRVPSSLRGLVELHYDLNNNAGYRFIESLLYKSDFYTRDPQTVRLSLTTTDDRPFALSTPRLPEPDTVDFRWPFDDGRIDVLSEMKTQPGTWRDILKRLDIPSESAEQMRLFFTPDPPPRCQRYTGTGVRWRYFGHACILIETRNLTVLLDPVVSYGYESSISRYTYADLPEHIDFVLITHNHQDHILFETLLQLRHKIGQVIVPRSGVGSLQDPSLKLILQNCGFRNVVELCEMDRIEIEDGCIQALPFLGEHADLAVSTKAAYLLKLGKTALLFAADSCNVEPELYRRLALLTGDVPVLFIGMECDGAPLSWLYGPLQSKRLERGMDESRRLNGSDFAQAIAVVEALRCREVYVYAMGQEPWLNHVMSIKYTNESRPIVESNRLMAECEARGIVAERLFGEKEILIDQVFDETVGLAPATNRMED
jgi:L-ascorbate metabolism protein UlaG (beta-lactamase superfamily)